MAGSHHGGRDRGAVALGVDDHVEHKQQAARVGAVQLPAVAGGDEELEHAAAAGGLAVVLDGDLGAAVVTALDGALAHAEPQPRHHGRHLQQEALPVGLARDGEQRKVGVRAVAQHDVALAKLGAQVLRAVGDAEERKVAQPVRACLRVLVRQLAPVVGGHPHLVVRVAVCRAEGCVLHAQLQAVQHPRQHPQQPGIILHRYLEHRERVV
mmetsp:Transcript_37810/g.96797  ORF Transcript_37810/g.96797 Transcript_37810/m.96797 type:complete len:210 (-) Transcript_37810:427-1056(-)